MSHAIKLTVRNNDFVSAINNFLRLLLEKEIVDIIIAPMESEDNASVFPTLITTPMAFDNGNINPVSPVMPVSMATWISKMTRQGKFNKKVAVVMKPCEIRTLIELVKLKQAELGNLVIIGVDCAGTVSITDYNHSKYDSSKTLTFELFNKISEGGTVKNLRSACRVCEHPVPNKYADLEIQIFGVDFNNSVFVFSKTEAGKQILEHTRLPLVSIPESREQFVNEIIQNRLKIRNAFFKKTQQEIAGINGLKKLFSPCINCHNCMKACPICFCKECFFESPTFEYTSRKYEMWAGNKGVFSVPNDKILFHLGRLTHMATSCTGCGLCEQACPVDIPLLKLFKLVGYNVQLVFEYEPGRELEEPLPLTTFKEVELEKIVGRGEG